MVFVINYYYIITGPVSVGRLCVLLLLIVELIDYSRFDDCLSFVVSTVSTSRGDEGFNCVPHGCQPASYTGDAWICRRATNHISYMGNLISKPLGVLIGSLYPAYRSFKALESPLIDDDKQWLTYWVVNSFFRFGEYFTDPVLPSAIPFYYSIKLVFLVWLMHPQTRGALTVYAQFVAPYLRTHEQEIDKALDTATKEVQRRGSAVKDHAAAWLERKKNEAAQYLKNEAANQLSGNEDRAP